ncbi:uncharacterized protein BP01DRAFT_199844 [Aspergillus saccharolyticus JOP 1030-1]|uniref:Uncharacterized protein n=1 Tax=Aspergillus saccharolyticus JOP 1030-1 TaxID=1450539 RepID=A0A319A7Z8_9EURO|nr:hypothetical protein BP01DRAFT_199844 [Aspergillus saccharolyticus JOP 1030-1]PYH47898.1 hypothetical protein BP01DRAFT_199844 [Aspergillus saccharolyticus JOP 1030-1]
MVNSDSASFFYICSINTLACRSRQLHSLRHFRTVTSAKASSGHLRTRVNCRHNPNARCGYRFTEENKSGRRARSPPRQDHQSCSFRFSLGKIRVCR